MGETLRHHAPALLACALVIVRLARRRHRDRGRSNTIGWIVLLAIAISLTVKTPTTYHAAGHLTGIPNVARLLDHGCLMLAAWGGQDLLLHVSNPRDARRRSVPSAIWMATAFAAMCVVFALTSTPVDNVRFAGQYGQTPGVLEYWLVYVAGVVPAVVNSAWLSARYAGMNTDPGVRLGLRLISAGALSLLVYQVHKAVFFAARRFDLPYPKAVSTPLDRYAPLAAALLVLIGLALPIWRTPAPIGKWFSNYRTYLRLRPLWLALYRVDPTFALVPPRPLPVELLNVRDLDLRLYRRVVEIRDGRLALRGRLDGQVAAAATEKAAAAGLTGQQLDATVEAVTLFAAIHAPAGRPADALPVPGPGGRDLASDTAFLNDVALAYRDLRRRCSVGTGVADRKRAGEHVSAVGESGTVPPAEAIVREGSARRVHRDEARGRRGI